VSGSGRLDVPTLVRDMQGRNGRHQSEFRGTRWEAPPGTFRPAAVPPRRAGARLSLEVMVQNQPLASGAMMSP
jgi:hypothetical protein